MQYKTREFIINRNLKTSSKKQIASERNKLLRTIVGITEVPMIVLGFIWLGLLVLELLDKTGKVLERLGIAIWVIFILDFLLKFIISATKIKFIKENIVTIISLIIPAFRLLRIFRLIRLLRFSRGLRLVKVIGSFNRGMRALSSTMKKRALGYVIILSAIVILIGAAGLMAFEREVNDGFKNYSSSLWWTAMLLISMGTENWPVTPEGRTLCFLIAIYGLAVFGYVTASIASFFIGRDAANSQGAGSKQIEELKKEILFMRNEILKLRSDKT